MAVGFHCSAALLFDSSCLLSKLCHWGPLWSQCISSWKQWIHWFMFFEKDIGNSVPYFFAVFYTLWYTIYLRWQKKTLRIAISEIWPRWVLWRTISREPWLCRWNCSVVWEILTMFFGIWICVIIIIFFWEYIKSDFRKHSIPNGPSFILDCLGLIVAMAWARPWGMFLYV